MSYCFKPLKVSNWKRRAEFGWFGFSATIVRPSQSLSLSLQQSRLSLFGDCLAVRSLVALSTRLLLQRISSRLCHTISRSIEFNNALVLVPPLIAFACIMEVELLMLNSEQRIPILQFDGRFVGVRQRGR